MAVARHETAPAHQSYRTSATTSDSASPPDLWAASHRSPDRRGHRHRRADVDGAGGPRAPTAIRSTGIGTGRARGSRYCGPRCDRSAEALGGAATADGCHAGSKLAERRRRRHTPHTRRSASRRPERGATSGASDVAGCRGDEGRLKPVNGGCGRIRSCDQYRATPTCRVEIWGGKIGLHRVRDGCPARYRTLVETRACQTRSRVQAPIEIAAGARRRSMRRVQLVLPGPTFLRLTSVRDAVVLARPELHDWSRCRHPASKRR